MGNLGGCGLHTGGASGRGIPDRGRSPEGLRLPAVHHLPRLRGAWSATWAIDPLRWARAALLRRSRTPDPEGSRWQPGSAARLGPGSMSIWSPRPEGTLVTEIRSCSRACPETKASWRVRSRRCRSCCRGSAFGPELPCKHEDPVDRVTLKSRRISTSPTSRRGLENGPLPTCTGVRIRSSRVLVVTPLAATSECLLGGGRDWADRLTRRSNQRPTPPPNCFAADSPTEAEPSHKPCSTDEFVLQR